MLGETLGRWQFGCSSSLQSRLLPDASAGFAGHAAARVHLSCRRGLDWVEPAVEHRRAGHRLSVLLFIINVLRSWRSGLPAGSDPWGAGTLEWSVASPPPSANFNVVPVVHALDPLWQPPGRRAMSRACPTVTARS
jgi:cytochrome c oxidase subunit I+III